LELGHSTEWAPRENLQREKREGGREGKRSKKSKCLVMEIRKEIEKARHRATKARSCRTDRLSPQKG